MEHLGDKALLKKPQMMKNYRYLLSKIVQIQGVYTATKMLFVPFRIFLFAYNFLSNPVFIVLFLSLKKKIKHDESVNDCADDNNFGSIGVYGQSVTQENLRDQNGSQVLLFMLTNKAGNILKVTNYGARIVRIDVPDKNGVKDYITISSEKLESIVRGDPFGGASIGRFANRIANGKFTLDGKEYNLSTNNKPNTLHGGRNGWFSKVWSGEIVKNSKEPSVKFTYVSPDMEEGFPGTVNISITYTWKNKNEIIIDYAASTDKKTVITVLQTCFKLLVVVFSIIGETLHIVV